MTTPNVQPQARSTCEAWISDREEGQRLNIRRVIIVPKTRRCRNRPRYRVNGRNVCAVHRGKAGSAE